MNLSKLYAQIAAARRNAACFSKTMLAIELIFAGMFVAMWQSFWPVLGYCIGIFSQIFPQTFAALKGTGIEYTFISEVVEFVVPFAFYYVIFMIITAVIYSMLEMDDVK